MALFDVPITWGGVRLWCEAGDGDGSRSIAPHDLVQGDSHPLHDAGLGVRPLRLSLLFDAFPGETLSPEERLQRLIAQQESGRAFMLSHPIAGNYLAKIGEFRWAHDDDSVITAQVTFYREESDDAISPAGAGVPAIAGESSVAAAADDLDGLVVGFDVEMIPAANAITAKAREAVASWSESEEVPTREITTDVADISTSIGAFISDYQLEEDLALFDVWLGAIMLGDAVRAAAVAATAEVPSVFTVRISEPVVLLALCAQIYGGTKSETRERQVRQLNDLRSSAWIGPGSYAFPARDR